jgi:hypothetical protein
MSFTSSGAAAHLPSLSVDVTAFGAKGDGIADDSPAFRSAIAAVRSAGGGRVVVPACKSPGAYYRLDKDASKPASINIENSTVPLEISGAGAGSRLVFAGEGNGGAWSMFRIKASANITFIGLYMEQGHIVNQDPDLGADPHHLIHLDNTTAGGNPQRDIQNIRIAGNIFRYCRGDHVRMWAEFGWLTKHVWVVDNWMDGGPTGFLSPEQQPNAGIRSCVQVSRNCEMVWITDNYMTRSHKAEIDFEPTGTGPVRGFFVERNIINHAPHDDTQAASAAAISGNGPTEPNISSTFKNNYVFNGGLQMEQLDRCDISDNKIFDSRKHVNPSIHLNGRNSFVRVERNYVHRYSTNTSAYQPVLLIQHGGGATDVPSNIRVSDNDFVQEKYSSVAYIEGVVEHCRIDGNRFYYNGSNYVASDGNPETVDDGNIFHLLVESDGKTPAAEVEIVNNWFGGTGSTRSCLQLNANVGDLGHCVVNGNTFRQAATGVEINRGSTYVIPSLTMQGNSNFCTTKWSKPGLMALHPIIAGNLGGVCTFETNATPEGAIAAPVGSMAVNTAGSTSTTLYVKTSGTGNTGWTAK